MSDCFSYYCQTGYKLSDNALSITEKKMLPYLQVAWQQFSVYPDFNKTSTSMLRYSFYVANHIQSESVEYSYLLTFLC